MNRKVIVVFPLIVMLYFLVPSSSFADELTVGNGQGQPWPFPSYNDREVVISLNNLTEVTSMEMDICDDVEDYLKAVDCTFTTRQVGSDCTCVATEPGGDCAEVSFVGTDCSILQGTGPIFTLIYDVRPGAPLQECRDLNPQEVEVNGSPFTGQLTSGEFCFVCAADVDCISSNPNFCWDQFCNLDSQDPDYGTCYSVYGLSCPDDGLYCNGLESCDSVDQECKHEYTSPETICNHPGSPLPLLCDEGLNLCYCDDDAQCSDGLNCTGVETCDTGGSYGICQPGVPFCAAPTPVCDEGPPTQCFEEDVTITVGDLSGDPGSQDNEVEVSLLNPNDNVIQITALIYDEGNYLSCTGCDPLAARCDQNCTCTALEGEAEGSCLVTLSCYNLDPFTLIYTFWPILEEDGPVLTVYYDVSEETPSGCIDLDLEVNQVLTWLGGDTIGDLWALPVAGEFCDKCPGDFNCDGDVDGTDTTTFLADLGRYSYNNPCIASDPCNGDFDCDGDVDGTDTTTFLADLGRYFYNMPCGACDPEEPYCAY